MAVTVELKVPAPDTSGIKSLAADTKLAAEAVTQLSAADKEYQAQCERRAQFEQKVSQLADKTQERMELAAAARQKLVDRGVIKDEQAPPVAAAEKTISQIADEAEKRLRTAQGVQDELQKRGVLPKGKEPEKARTAQEEAVDWHSKKMREEEVEKEKRQMGFVKDKTVQEKAAAERKRIDEREQIDAELRKTGHLEEKKSKDPSLLGQVASMTGFGGASSAYSSGAMGLAGAAASWAAMQAFEKGLGTATAHLSIISNEFLTTAHKTEMLRESVPIFGSVFKAMREFSEALDGTTATLRRNEINFAVRGVRMGAEGQRDEELLRINTRRTELQGRATGTEYAAEQVRRIAANGFAGDRTTAMGEREYQHSVAMSQHGISRAQAEGGVKAATLEKDQATKYREEVEKKLATSRKVGKLWEEHQADLKQSENGADAKRRLAPLQRDLFLNETAQVSFKAHTPAWGEQAKAELARLQKEHGSLSERKDSVQAEVDKYGDGDPQRRKAEIDTVARNLAENQNKQLQLTAQLKAASGVEDDKILKLGQAQMEVQKAINAAKKEELNYAKSLEASTTARAQAFGALNKGERMTALAATKFVKQHGVEVASSWDLSAIQRAGGGEWLAKQYEKSATKDPGFAELSKEFGMPHDLEEQRKKVAKLEMDVNIQGTFDEANLANRIAKAMESLLTRMENLAKTTVSVEVKKFEQGRVIGQNAGK